MAKYLVLARIEPQHKPGAGAAPGQIVAIRAVGEAGFEPTRTEKRTLFTAYVTLTKAEYQQLLGKQRPQATFAPVGEPPAKEEDLPAWMAAMEAERKKLVEAGHNLRRLNQAYFAFHGSYATSPASVDPIGPWLRQLRAQSGSLKAFLETASQLRSLDDLLDVLEE